MTVGRSRAYKDMAEIRLKLRNQAVLAEQAARKLWAFRPSDWPEPTSEAELRDQVDKLKEEHGKTLSKAELKAMTRMATLHRWEQAAEEEKANQAAADARVEQKAKDNGLSKEEYVLMVYLMVQKAQKNVSEKGEAKLRELMDKSDAHLKTLDDAAAADIAKMREEMVRGQ